MWRLLPASVAIALLTGPAFAQTAGTYFTIEGGFSLPTTISLNLSAAREPVATRIPAPGRSYGASYGYNFGNGFRTEVESFASYAASERYAELGAGASLSSTTVMLNGLYEFTDDGVWHMKPFVGAGFGMIDVNQSILGVSGNDWATAYQVRGGVTLGLSQKLLGSLEYRWTMGSKPHFSLAGIPTKLEVDRHGFVLGFNYKY
jgi:opacity protein-like surface antigen